MWSKDNTALALKIEIRNRLLKAVPKPSVLDCFAGEGFMHRQCYSKYPYLGLDRSSTVHDKVISIDNRKFLRSSDLSKYNFFDLDAYGSPWHQFLIIMNRRRVAPGERIAIVMTDGLNVNFVFNKTVPYGMAEYVYMPPGMIIPALNRHQDFIRKLIVVEACHKAHVIIEKAYIADNKYFLKHTGRTGKPGHTAYLGLLLKGAKG